MNEGKEIKATDNDTIFPSKAVQNVINVTKDIPNYDSYYFFNNDEKYIKQPSMAQGTATFCLKTLVAREDMHQAQANIKEIKEKEYHFVRIFNQQEE